MISAWTAHDEHPGRQAAAAYRATKTAERRVVDASFDYQNALLTGDQKKIDAAQAELRAAYETDVRRKGWKPEDYAAGYPNYDVMPVVTFGDTLKSSKWLHLLLLAGVAYFAYTRFV